MNEWQKGIIVIRRVAKPPYYYSTVDVLENKAGETLRNIFGIFQNDIKKDWNLTHCSSGLMVSCFKRKQTAQHVAEALLTIEGIKWKNKKLRGLTRKQNERVQDILRREKTCQN